MVCYAKKSRGQKNNRENIRIKDNYWETDGTIGTNKERRSRTSTRKDNHEMGEDVKITRYRAAAKYGTRDT